ncbi:MAG: phage holin family protein [Oscillospiraceae bacterium]|nr:phage holin family protein [Oscillospiraceae bacterium]
MSDFNGKLAAVCAAVGAVGGVIARALGGWDNAVVTLIIFMVIDYAMGIIVAAVFKKSEKSENGGLSSRVCWIGLARKVMTLLLVIIANRLDVLIGTDYIRTGVIISFCASELISICENAGLMGVPLPSVITKAIDILKSKEEDHDDN